MTWPRSCRRWRTTKTVQDRPVALIAHTIKGKGVSFMDGNFRWHSRVPTDEELATALAELGQPGVGQVGRHAMMLSQGKALRAVFGETIAELGNDDPRIVVLDGDVASSTGAAAFEAAHPDRFLQMGITEQAMLGVAAGLATVGFIPVATTFACFAVSRGLDPIRVLIAQPCLNVKIAAGYSGLLTGMTGKTHQMFDDVAIMRTLPNMTVLAPADEVETAQAIRAMIATDGPFYLQLTREASPMLFGPDYKFEVGRAVRLRTGCDVDADQYRRPERARACGSRDPGQPRHRRDGPACSDGQADR